MSPTPTANFSELVQRPKDTVEKLRFNARHALLLTRRDDQDLYLTTAERAEQVTEVLDSTTRVFVALMQSDPAARELLLNVFPAAFPWVKFLPEEAVREFLVEFVETARASAELDLVGPIATVIAAWKSTAEIHADPELYARLTADHGGEEEGQRVTLPEVADE